MPGGLVAAMAPVPLSVAEQVRCQPCGCCALTGVPRRATLLRARDAVLGNHHKGAVKNYAFDLHTSRGASFFVHQNHH